MPSPAEFAQRAPVVAVSSNKGGVGKTTLAANLAVYVGAMRDDLPVLIIGLDDQRTLDRMFAIEPPSASDRNLKHAWSARDLRPSIRAGHYGVHFVPSPPDVASLKARAEDPRILARMLERADWPGLVLLDTKSDVEALTRSAWYAADRVLVPVSDWSSLEEAGRVLDLVEHTGSGADRVRLVFTLVDRRTKVGGVEELLLRRLVDAAYDRGWRYYKTHISRSPRVEALNSGGDRPLSILHHGRGTAVYTQLRELALELLDDLGLAGQCATPVVAVTGGQRRRPSGRRPGRVAREKSPASALLSGALALTSALRRMAENHRTEER